MSISDIRKIFTYIFKTSDIQKDLILIDQTKDDSFLNINLYEDLKLEQEDILILYLNTCSIFKTHKLALDDFEKTKTINDIYQLLKEL